MLMAEKVDRRVRKTKAQLRAGLARLMQKKSIKEITVKELVDEVDINRSTFYLHYETLEDLLSESVEYMNEQFLAYMKQDTNVFMIRILECPLDELYLVTPQYLTPYLKYIKENKRLFLTAVKNTKALRLEESYDKMFQFVFAPVLERYQVSDEIRKYMMAFYVQGLMAIIAQWLKNDCEDTIEQMIDVMQKCTGQHK